jgi:isoleucyl-tRNA synthetase
MIPFTAEETWKFIRHRSMKRIVTKEGLVIRPATWRDPNRPESVHEQRVFARRKHPDADQHEEAMARYMARWESILAMRSRVNEKLEEARRDKKIGKSLEACVEIKTRETFYEGAIDPAQLDEVFMVSKLVVTPAVGEETITVTRAEDHGMKKCVRCWKYWDHVGSHADHPELCDRCTKVVLNLGQPS